MVGRSLIAVILLEALAKRRGFRGSFVGGTNEMTMGRGGLSAETTMVEQVAVGGLESLLRGEGRRGGDGRTELGDGRGGPGSRSLS